MLQPDSLVLDGRFRVVRLLSEGGMGEVYLAEQVSLGRKVALKVLRADLSPQHQASERFRREARLLSSVEHPSVVGVIDFGEWEDRPCLVMELANGETLQQALEPGPFPPERAVPVLIQLADGLAAIHEKGIIHRDLKPENVVLTRSVRGEQARLLDFGIARLAEPEGGPPPDSLSVSGVILGTPEYVSPEQGYGGHLDARSDLYSFGVLAYRTLSGKLPFVGPSPRSFVAQHLSEEPIPLYQAAPELVANVPLCELVMQCLKKNPAERPQTALELSEALSKVMRAPRAGPLAPEPPTPARAPQAPGREPVTRPVDPDALAKALREVSRASQADPRLEAATIPVDLDALERALQAVSSASHADPRTAPARAPWTDPAPEPVTVPEDVHARGYAPQMAPEATTARVPHAGSPPAQRRASRAVPLRPPSRRRLTRARLIAAGAVVLIALLVLGAIAVSRLRLENRARALLDGGHPEKVLELLGADDAPERTPLARVKALRAAALHRLDRHQEELREASGVDLEAVGDLDQVLLDGLMQDYGRSHGRDRALRKYYNSWPHEQIRDPLKAMASGPPSPRQWGALRYLDQAGIGQ
ncbi:MAG TPA: protein kinase, partial [Myxococcales bacterium]|nr:protein kinase [Myxococcales bacterium]